MLSLPAWIGAALFGCAAFTMPHVLRADSESARPIALASPVGTRETAGKHSVLAAYISGRWRIDVATAKQYVFVADEASRTTAVDPLLLLAVIARESGFVYTGNQDDLRANIDSSSVDPLRPHGPMQVDGRWHLEKMPVDARGLVRPTTLEENVRLGAEVLAEYLAGTGGDLTRALQRYNGCRRAACESYPAAVLRMRDELHHIVQGA